LSNDAISEIACHFMSLRHSGIFGEIEEKRWGLRHELTAMGLE
jgi:hypothetical protein